MQSTLVEAGMFGALDLNINGQELGIRTGSRYDSKIILGRTMVGLMTRLIMKKTAILITAIVLVCGLLGIFWVGFSLPKKPCRPIVYPSGARTTDEMSYVSSDAYDEIVKFYEINLSPKDISIANFGEWVREMINPSTVLYHCYSPDINGLTTESGCIYVRNTGEVTSIEIQFYRSEGGYVPCPR